jgi:hypothetical protein
MIDMKMSIVLYMRCETKYKRQFLLVIIEFLLVRIHAKLIMEIFEPWIIKYYAK